MSDRELHEHLARLEGRLVAEEQRAERYHAEVVSLLHMGLRQLGINTRLEIRNMAKIDDVITQVQANTDAEASAAQLLGQLHQLLVDAGTDPGKLDQIKNSLSSSRDALAAAIVANTPADTSGSGGGSNPNG